MLIQTSASSNFYYKNNNLKLILFNTALNSVRSFKLIYKIFLKNKLFDFTSNSTLLNNVAYKSDIKCFYLLLNYFTSISNAYN